MISPIPSTTTSPDRGAPRRRLPLAVAYLLAAIAMLANYLGVLPWMALTMIPGLSARIQAMPAGVQMVFGLLQSLTIALVAVIIVWALMRWVCRGTLREAGLFVSRKSAGMLVIGVVTSCLVVLPTMFALRAFGLAGQPEVIDAPVGLFVIQALILGFVMQAFPEELVWRGYALQLLRNRPIVSVVACSVLFGLMHLASHSGATSVEERIAYLAWPAGFGFLAGALVLATKSLWAAVGVHGGSHLASLLLTLSHVGQGLWVAWLVVGAVYLVAGLIVLAVWRRRETTPHRVEYLY